MENEQQQNENTQPKSAQTIAIDFAGIADNSELTTWLEFRDGFELEVRYIPRSELQALSKKCTTARFNPKSHQREVELDPEKFAPKFVQAAVRGWRGLTPKKLATFIRVDMSKIPADKLDAEIPYTSQQMIYLMKNCYDLDAFLNSIVTDLRAFEPETHEEETKN